MTTLFLDGRPGTGKNSQRFLAVIDGVDYWLRQKEFTYLVKLALAGGWLEKMKLEPTRNVDKYVGRLRNEVKLYGLKIANDRHGRYRLVLDPDSIGYDLDNIICLFK